MGCKGRSVVESPPSVMKSPLINSLGRYRDRPDPQGLYNDLSVWQLKEQLLRNPVSTGFKEVPFNACSTKANLSPSPRCQVLYLSRLGLSMACRQISAQGHFLPSRSIGSAGFSWRVGRSGGTFRTEDSGHGAFYWVSSRSSRRALVRIQRGSHILKKRASEPWTVILPKSWCGGL